MVNEGSKQSIRKNLEQHLDNPVSLLTQLKNRIFGKENPDTYTQVSFFIGLAIVITFLIWSILGYVVIDGREWIQAEKGLNVQNLIEKRGVELGFEANQFLHKLEMFYAFSIFIWLVILIGLILQWRKIFAFIYVITIAASLYLLYMWFGLGFEYWLDDTTLFDKISFFLLIGHSFLYAFFLKKELSGEEINFFGLDE